MAVIQIFPSIEASLKQVIVISQFMEFRILHRIREHGAAVYSLAAGRQPHTVFSASGDRYVTEWNVLTGKQVAFAVRLEQPGYATAYIAKFNLLLVANSIGGLHVINLLTSAEERYILNHSNGIFDLKFDEDRDILYVAGGDGVLSIWQLPSFELLRSIKLCDGKIRQIALSGDYRHAQSHSDVSSEPYADSGFSSVSLIALACGDGYLRILENNFYNELYTINAHTDGVTSVAWHPQKPVLLTGGKDAYIRIWNRKEEFAEVLSIPAHNFAIYAIAFSPDGKLVATASRDKTIKIWDAKSMDPLYKIDFKAGGHSHSVNSVIWLNNQVLVSCSDDRSILVFDRSAS